MRFVGVKTEEQQAQGMAFRVRDLFVHQRTQMINALRGHLAEYGVTAPQGVVDVSCRLSATRTAVAPTAGSSGSWHLRASVARRARNASRPAAWRPLVAMAPAGKSAWNATVGSAASILVSTRISLPGSKTASRACCQAECGLPA